jgi:hypothetical protein
VDARILLVPAIHEIAPAAELAIATGPAEKSDAYTLADGPTPNTVTDQVYAADHLMAGDARVADREESVHCRRIRMADATRLHTNAYLMGTGIHKRPSDFREHSRL